MPVKKAAPKEAVKKAPAKEAAPKPAVKKTAPKPDLRSFLGEIEKRAYDHYLDRKKNHLPGDEMSDWLAAEDDIKKRYGI